MLTTQQCGRFCSGDCLKQVIVILMIAGLSMIGGPRAVAAASTSGGPDVWKSDPVRTDIDVSGPFLQPRHTHDYHLIHRCGEPEIAQDARQPNTLIIVCNSIGTLNYQSPAPTIYLAWWYRDPAKPSKEPWPPCFAFISHDGGRSWQKMPDPFESKLITGCGDPLAASGPKGELYIGDDALHYPIDPKFSPSGPLLGIGFSSSVDGGKTWSEPVVIPTGVDRPFWAVDQSSGAIYDLSACAGVHAHAKGSFGCTPDSRNLAVSTNEGRTWSPSVDEFNKLTPVTTLSAGRLHNIGGSVVVAARGVVATAGGSHGGEERETWPPGGDALYFKYSTDEGRTFTQRSIPISGSQPCEPRTVQGVAADPAHRGVFTVLVGCALDPKALQVYVTDDLGASWKRVATLAVVPPPDYQGRPSDYDINRPWVAYSPNGELGVFWRENYGIPTPRPMATVQFGPQDVFLAIAADGRTFGPPIRLNSAASPPADPRQWAADDISDLILDRHYAYAVWGDWRSGELEVWLRKVRLPAR